MSVTRPTGEKVDVDARPTGEGDSTVTDQLASLLGLGDTPKAARQRPNGATDLPLAIARVNAFRAKAGGGVWTNLDRIAVADRLVQLLNDPDKVNQGSIGVCGPAVFFNVWIEADPLQFAIYATEMYEKGEAMIGTRKVTAGADLRHQDYAVLRPKLNPDVPPADWMVMSALRDSENGWFDFEGTPQEDFSGGTSRGEIARWLQSTHLFSSVDDSGTPLIGDNLDQAKGLNPTANRKVILFVDTNMIDTTRAKGKGKHFIVLRSRVTQLANGNVDFTYWTWGDPPATVTQPLTKARFDDTYLGYITAEF